MIKHNFTFSVFVLCFFALSCSADDTAELLFDNSAPLVYQVKVIDNASGNKSSIGSGFQVSPTGVIATNYHVVSKFILESEKYSIVVLDNNDITHDASLITFDIVHDLALLQVNNLKKSAFKLNSKSLSNGSRIYSMGNPHDLGMTIIEGNYNGLVEGSRYKKYLFSGSLNPGMSGGPVLNREAEIIGINVSKGGEQLSFLVPVKHLMDLMAQGHEPLTTEEYGDRALKSLISDQDSYYSMLFQLPWITKEFQDFDLPDKIHESLKCWGHTLKKKQNRFDETHRHCKTKDRIFLKTDLYTGGFAFNYESISSDELNTLQFYSLLEENYQIGQFSNGNDKEDTTNIECVTDFLELDKDNNSKTKPWKVTTCIREYIDYRGLYDTGLIAIYAYTENNRHQALIISLMITGIEKNNISSLHTKFLGSVKWKQ